VKVKIIIDGKTVEAAEGSTILQASEKAGLAIPHLCYHPAFAPEGSCRMCLVEIEGLPKLELACSTLVREGLKIQTKSPRVVEARKAVLEFLLAEHPLDCPICDKAGECKLQDYFEEYGLFESRFREIKEKREKKFRLGKRLILDRERCILCTRCVRYLGEVTRTGEAGVVHRGIRSEIGLFESELIDHLYSGNLTELCPVGAITDTDFRFKTRVWFLEKKASLCTLCGRGCNIFIEFHPGFPRTKLPRRVYRIRARENPMVNRFWICDFGRYGYAYLDENRQDRLVQKKGNRKTTLTKEKAVGFLTEKINGMKLMGRLPWLAVVLHSGLSNEEIFLARKLFLDGLGLEKVFLSDPPPGKGDDFLLTSERTPNKRGWQEIGIPSVPPELLSLAESTHLLIIFGHHFASNFNPAELRNVLNRIPMKILLSSHRSPLDDLMDIIIPTPVIAEKSGTLTNSDGIVQPFEPALQRLEEAVPEGDFILDLARELKVDRAFFWPLRSTEAVYRALADEIPFFK